MAAGTGFSFFIAGKMQNQSRAGGYYHESDYGDK
jgi:hypothetical protein